MKQKIFHWIKNLGVKKIIIISASAIILLCVVTTIVLFRFKSDNQNGTKKGSPKTTTPKKSGTPTLTPSSSSSPKASGTPETPTPTPTTPLTNEPPPPDGPTIYGPIDSTPINDIENSLVLAISDGINDYTNPGGGGPPGGVYAYPPVDTRNVYMGVRNERLYIKFTLGGNIPSSQQIYENNTITSVTYNISVDADGNTENSWLGAETHMQLNIHYESASKIWVTPWYRANFIDFREPEGYFEKTGDGILHSAHGGLGSNQFLISYALPDLLGTVFVGQNVNLNMWSEAESNLWHHFSFDQSYNPSRGDEWIPWTVQGI